MENCTLIGRAVLLQKGTGKRALPHTKHGENLYCPMLITDARSAVLPKNLKLTTSETFPTIQNSGKQFQMVLACVENVIKSFIPFTG